MCAMRVFNVGDVLAASDTNEYLVNTRYAVKAADTSRASNTTLANDPDLTIAVDASKSYMVDCVIPYTAVASTGDLKYAFTVPAGAVFTGTATAYSGAGLFVATYQGSGTLLTSTQTGAGGGAVIQPLLLKGVLVTSVTAGSLTLQWAQNASNVTATIVKAGSYMLLRRVS